MGSTRELGPISFIFGYSRSLWRCMLWMGGFFLELLSHMVYSFFCWIMGCPGARLPLANVDLAERLDTITMIILGEVRIIV